MVLQRLCLSSVSVLFFCFCFLFLFFGGKGVASVLRQKT